MASSRLNASDQKPGRADISIVRHVRNQVIEEDMSGITLVRLEVARRNLVALSSLYNLFFIAQRESIRILQPEYPDQSVSATNGVLVVPPNLDPDDIGFMNDDRPHSINNMIVGFLGNEEILLFCSDAGYVYFYYTKQLQLLVQNPPENPRQVVEIEPSFREYVRDSAWGLSIHRASRKIAVSCNTTKVHIYCFAMRPPIGKPTPIIKTDKLPAQEFAPVSLQSKSGSSWRQWDKTAGLALTRVRSFSIEITRQDGTNIPSVAFCNTPDDPHGYALAVGDIAGETRIYDLGSWSIGTPQEFTSWTAHFCVRLPGASLAEQFYSCQSQPGHQYTWAVWGVHWIDPRAFRRTTFRPADLPGKKGYKAQENDFVDLTGTLNEAPDCAANRRQNCPGGGTVSDSQHPLVVSGPFPTGHYRINRYGFQLHYECSQVGKPIFPDAAVLWLSTKDITMIQPHDDGILPLPIVGMCEPLSQKQAELDGIDMHPSYPYTAHNRFAFSTVIPELGIMLAASPSGRCLVMSLQVGENSRGKSHYSFRVDHVLPTKEEADLRPGFALMGIAASPIQGEFGPPIETRARKWRIALYYYNHEVLWYELERDDPAKGVVKVEDHQQSEWRGLS